MQDGEPESSIAQTYRGLRLGMVVLVLLLFGSVVFEIVRTAILGQLCLQPSLSAYYYTPARPVFVAALGAVGAALVIYRGTTNAENVLLDFAGFFAFVVAFVPTRIGTSQCDTSDVPTAGDISAAEANNVLVLLVIAVVAVVMSLLMGSERYTRRGESLLESARTSAVLCLVALVLGLVLFILVPEELVRYGHQFAAAALFAAILAVVFINAADVSRKSDANTRPWYRTPYAAVGLVTVAVAVLTWLAGRLVPGFTIWFFFVEAELILGFAVFWVIQTVELGGQAHRTGG